MPAKEPVRGPGDARLAVTTWDQALDALGGRLRDLRAQGRAAEVVILTRPVRGQQSRPDVVANDLHFVAAGISGTIAPGGYDDVGPNVEQHTIERKASVGSESDRLTVH